MLSSDSFTQIIRTNNEGAGRTFGKTISRRKLTGNLCVCP